MPAGSAATQPGGELERAEEGVDGRAEDVHDHGCRGGVDARVGGQQLRAAGDLDAAGVTRRSPG